MAHDVGYYHTEVCFLLYIAYNSRVKRGQERFKSEFLEARRPAPSPFEKRDYGKKSAVSIRKLILEVGEAFVSGIKCSHNSRTNGMQRVRNYIQATFLILDALHYAETNGYWYLYRSAVPLFAELELQRGKIESARRRIEEILPQVAREDDIEQRALAYAVYAKVRMASDRLGTKGSFESPLGMDGSQVGRGPIRCTPLFGKGGA